MKKLQILAWVLLLAGTFSLQAQTTIGGRIGANIGLATVDGLADLITPDISALNTFTGGLTINQRLDDRLSFTSGVHYKRKGFVASESIGIELFEVNIPVGAKAETRLDYIEVPILLNIGFNNGQKVQPYIEFGPAFSYAVSGEIQPSLQVVLEINTPKIDLDLSKDIYNRFEVAGQGVAGIKIPYGAGIFDLGVSYTHAFTDMLADPVLDIKLRNYGIGLHAGFAMTINGNDTE